MPRRVEEGRQEVGTVGPGPSKSLENSSKRKEHSGLISSQGAEDMALTQITGVWGPSVVGQVACSVQVNLHGLGLEWEK